MGLDMYAYSVKPEVLKNPDQQFDLDLNIGPDGRLEKCHDWYWRKFNALHGWMHRLYREKGGADPQFNTNSVRLTLADIDRLEADLKAERLTPTPGFFFGGQTFDEDDKSEVQSFVDRARIELAEGRVVFYDSWW